MKLRRRRSGAQTTPTRYRTASAPRVVYLTTDQDEARPLLVLCETLNGTNHRLLGLDPVFPEWGGV